MRVRIEEIGLFDSNDAQTYTELQRLFMRAARGQHRLDLSDPEVVLASDFMKVAVAAHNRVEWEEIVRRTLGAAAFDARSAGPVALVSPDGRVPAGHLGYGVSAREVGAWSEQPLRVILENTRDGVLVALGARVTATGVVDLALNEGWLRLDGRGGCGEVKRSVEDSEPTDRLFVIIDSDREAAGDGPSVQARRIHELCEAAGIPVYVLRRRELENYVPPEVWKAKALRRVGRRAAGGLDARTVLVWRMLLRVLTDERIDAVRYGADAVERVTLEVEKRASRPLQKRTSRELLDEWLGMAADDRHVDDLKVRFGDDVAAEAVETISQAAFSVAALDHDAARELGGIASKLEEWL